MSPRKLTAPAAASASFPAEAVSVREARHFLRAFLRARRHEQVADAAELALSEVVTNAVLHAHASFDVAVLLSDDGSLRVEVTDRNPQLPVQRDYTEQATTGRGMELVAALTADCGVVSRGEEGKTVWFLVRQDGERHRDADELLDAWDIDAHEAAGSAGGVVTIVLPGMPLALWLAAREHHDAILRELVLYAAEHPAGAPSGERLALADQARAWISTHVAAALDQHAPTPAAGPSDHDLRVAVPADAATAFAALQDVLDTAERLATAGLLLIRPGLPEIVAVRDWAAEQAIVQLAGVGPSRWPGTGLERFSDDVRDHTEIAQHGWDATVVTDTDRGAVAADDANRILAISRPLAEALGWTPDDLVGRRIVALIPPELREAHVVGFTRHLTTGRSRVLGVPLRLPVMRRDGSRVDCELLIEQAVVTTGRYVYIAWIQPLAP